VTDELQARFEARIPEQIRALNADFRTATDEHADAVKPVVRLFESGEGPFAADADKIKQTRIVKLAPRG
jgi:hypothetical protein